MNILVTGGAGFIGSHITDELIRLGHSVHVADHLSTGKKEYLNPRAVFHQVDLLDSGMNRIFEEAKPEIVIHHAAQIDVQTSIRKPLLDAEVNILGTLALLERCRDYGVRKLIYASSAAVYGSPEYLPVDEKHPARPLSFYGISKHTPEHYIEAFGHLFGLDYTILRYANVYGVRQDPKGEGGVVSVFMGKLLTGEPAVIFGDGEQTRDWIYVKDVVKANIAALSRGSRSLLNIGCNRETSVNDLLRLMCELCGRPFQPVYAPARPGDIARSRLDNSAAADALGWTPQYTLRLGLEETCGYYRKFYEQ